MVLVNGHQAMSVWAIVPVKPLRRGKSRLAGTLSEHQRTELNRLLLIHTVQVVKKVSQVAQILVVSRDAAALAVARQNGARTLQEKGSPQLNTALMRATMVARSYAAPGVLVLPADLPLITVEDVEGVLAHAKSPPVVVVVPDRHCEGTNTLLVSPPGAIPYCFGTNSFEKHCQQARQSQIRLEICERETLALDVDWPEDLALLAETDNPELARFMMSQSSEENS